MQLPGRFFSPKIKEAEKRRNTSHVQFLTTHGVAPSAKNLAKLGAMNVFLEDQVALARHISDDMVLLWLVFRDTTNPDVLSSFDGDYAAAPPEHIDLMRQGLIARFTY